MPRYKDPFPLPVQANEWPVFSPGQLFRALYRDACITAVREYSANIHTQAKFVADLESEFCKQFGKYARKEGKSVKELHSARLYQLRSLLAPLQKNHQSCFCCSMSVPEKVLDCGHAYCDNCVRTFGCKSPTDGNTYVVSSCLMCGSGHSSRKFRFIPPTAGVRILSLDGGGVRGIVLLSALRYLDSELAYLGCPLQDHFDFVAGTSSGKPAT